MKLRPEVQRFAELMERVLRENDHKGGWEDESEDYLIERLEGEAHELRRALCLRCQTCLARNMDDPDSSEVLHEAADVANFAMMIACNEGGLMDGAP